MGIIERLAQWISDKIFGHRPQQSDEYRRKLEQLWTSKEELGARKKAEQEVCADLRVPRENVEEKKAVIDSLDLAKLKSVTVNRDCSCVTIDTEECIDDIKAKAAEKLAEKPKKAVTKKKTEGKAATKAKPASDEAEAKPAKKRAAKKASDKTATTTK